MFDAPKLKIKRANQHIAELNSVLVEFIKTDFYGFRVEHDAQSGYYSLYLNITKPLPCEIPLIIGDAIHNVRSALDLAACEIVVIAGGTPTKRTNFPFHKSRQELEAIINSGEIKIAGADIIDLILNVIKPYKGGNDALYGLHQLDITDKHRLLIPIFSVTALKRMYLTAGSLIFENFSATIGDGGEIGILHTPNKFEFKVQDYGEATCHILFNKGQIFEGQSVIPTLHQLSQLVSRVIETIEKAYLVRI